MLPLLWRYLLGNYLKTLTLCVAAFIAILLTMKMDEIAYFATLGPKLSDILYFTVQQIPYLIPIAMPIAALIASLLLVQTLSSSHELTALRASGFSLRDIISPILIVAAILSIGNFYVISELSSNAHLGAVKLKNQLRSINPLFLLHNKHVMQVKGFYFDTYGPSRLGEYAQDVIFLAPSKDSNRLNMLVAKELKSTSDHFMGQQVTLLTGRPSNEGEIKGENLVVENFRESSTTIKDFTQMLEQKIWSINNDHLRLPLLLLRIDEAKSELKSARAHGTPAAIKMAVYNLNRGYTEIIRRVSVSLAVFTFTLMGLAFGMNISRNRSSRGVVMVTFLAALYIVCFFGAKSFDYALISASLLYLMPHLVICISALWSLNKTAKGVE